MLAGGRDTGRYARGTRPLEATDGAAQQHGLVGGARQRHVVVRVQANSWKNASRKVSMTSASARSTSRCGQGGGTSKGGRGVAAGMLGWASRGAFLPASCQTLCKMRSGRWSGSSGVQKALGKGPGHLGGKMRSGMGLALGAVSSVQNAFRDGEGIFEAAPADALDAGSIRLVLRGEAQGGSARIGRRRGSGGGAQVDAVRVSKRAREHSGVSQ